MRCIKTYNIKHHRQHDTTKCKRVASPSPIWYYFEQNVEYRYWPSHIFHSRAVGSLEILGVQLGGLPNKVLNHVALVLRYDQVTISLICLGTSVTFWTKGSPPWESFMGRTFHNQVRTESHGTKTSSL